LTLGTYPALSLADARDKALKAKHDVAEGDDPATAKQQARHAPILADIAAEYLERHAKIHKKSWRGDKRMLDNDVLPAWGKRQATTITRRDVLALLDRIVERDAPIEANRVLALVRKMYNWAISRDLLEHNPCIQVAAPGREHQRERVLMEREIVAVWEACGQLSPTMEAFFKLRLLTAQRGEEVRVMRWADIDCETAWWTIPATITKNGLSHRVPLSAPALDILQKLQTTTEPGPWVFPSTRSQGQPIHNIRKPATRLKALTGIDFVPHDLRRTAASHMTSMGISRLVVGKILNHVEPGVTKVYDRHSYDAEKRQAIDVWGRKVVSIIAGETSKVIPLRREATQ
jgi:integrase